jgi:hypothetical protein
MQWRFWYVRSRFLLYTIIAIVLGITILSPEELQQIGTILIVLLAGLLNFLHAKSRDLVELTSVRVIAMPLLSVVGVSSLLLYSFSTKLLYPTALDKNYQLLVAAVLAVVWSYGFVYIPFLLQNSFLLEYEYSLADRKSEAEAGELMQRISSTIYDLEDKEAKSKEIESLSQELDSLGKELHELVDAKTTRKPTSELPTVPIVRFVTLVCPLVVQVLLRYLEIVTGS